MRIVDAIGRLVSVPSLDPDDARPYLFDPFRRVEGGAGREYQGAGLGLAIVRQMATLMGGRVELESQVGRGSTFTVMLPLVVEGSPAGEGEKPSTRG